jgi:uncharacterized SAM-binding protein YcdF (DUF218 family)
MDGAAALYHRGFSAYILPSGTYNANIPEFESEWAFLQARGIALNVPEHAILKEDRARNTFENARFSKRVLEDLRLPVRKAILLCKTYHARRALLTYQAVFPQGVEFFVLPVVDERGMTRTNWFTNPDHTAIVMGEVEKIGSYFLDVIPAWVKGEPYP